MTDGCTVVFCWLGNVALKFLLLYHINVSRISGLERRLKEFCMFFIKTVSFLNFFRKTANKNYLEIQATKMYLKEKNNFKWWSDIFIYLFSLYSYIF